MPKYSVLLLYPPYLSKNKTYFAHVEADDACKAANAARVMAAEAEYNPKLAEDFQPLAVFAGHVEMELDVRDFPLL